MNEENNLEIPEDFHFSLISECDWSPFIDCSTPLVFLQHYLDSKGIKWISVNNLTSCPANVWMVDFQVPLGCTLVTFTLSREVLLVVQENWQCSFVSAQWNCMLLWSILWHTQIIICTNWHIFHKINPPSSCVKALTNSAIAFPFCCFVRANHSLKKLWFCFLVRELSHPCFWSCFDFRLFVKSVKV